MFIHCKKQAGGSSSAKSGEPAIVGEVTIKGEGFISQPELNSVTESNKSSYTCAAVMNINKFPMSNAAYQFPAISRPSWIPHGKLVVSGSRP